MDCGAVCAFAPLWLINSGSNGKAARTHRPRRSPYEGQITNFYKRRISVFAHAKIQKDSFNISTASLHSASCLTFEVAASAGDLVSVQGRPPGDRCLGFKRAQRSEAGVDLRSRRID